MADDPIDVPGSTANSPMLKEGYPARPFPPKKGKKKRSARHEAVRKLMQAKD